MLKLKIRTRAGEYHAELDGSELAEAVWFSASPFTVAANELGNALYFEMPIETETDAERQTVFEIGDIAWWPGVNALVIFYGPTPLSGEDGKPVWRYGCVRIGHILGDCSTLEESGDRQKIVLEQEF